jgi:hypothetical protein
LTTNLASVSANLVTLQTTITAGVTAGDALSALATLTTQVQTLTSLLQLIAPRQS